MLFFFLNISNAIRRLYSRQRTFSLLEKDRDNSDYTQKIVHPFNLCVCVCTGQYWHLNLAAIEIS